MAEQRRYLFHPLERRGVVVGLQPAQLAALVGTVLLASLLVAVVPGFLGLLCALTALGLGAVGSCWPVAGRPPVSWLPVVSGWLRRRAGGPCVAGQPGTVGPPRPREVAGTTDVVPATGPPCGVGRRSIFGERCPRATRAKVTAPPGITLIEAPAGPGEPAMAVIRDRQAGTWAAVLAVRGQSLALLEPSEKERRLAAWGAILASLARAGTPIHLIQWIEISAAGDAEGLVRYLDDCGAEPIDGRVAAARQSYAELIATAGPASQEHQIILVIAVRPRVSRRQRGVGRGDGGTVELLRRELRLLQGQLRNAELTASEPWSRSQLAVALRAAGELSAPRSHRAIAAVAAGAWPMATDEAWSALRVDGAWHATYWVAEWPRLEVGPDFLTPLLLTPGHRRMSVLMAPVSPDRAARQIESARTADAADEELRRRAGFLATARRQRQAEGVTRREIELADGHAEYRFSGYVTVSAGGRPELESACAEVEQAAQQAHLDLRRLYGQQAEAFSWTQPLGRGLR